MSDKKTENGLKLTSGGAPKSYHMVLSPETLEPVPGYFHPEYVTPIGGTGELSLEQAKVLDKNKYIGLKLVSLSEEEATAARERLREAILMARQGIKAFRADSDIEQDLIRDQMKAVTKTNG